MKQQRSFPALQISPKGESALRAGHPWVYEGELRGPAPEIENGAVADVFSQKGAWLGAGLYSTKSKIRVRLLSRNANDSYDEAFFTRRIGYALDYRAQVMGPDFPRCCRLVFGEADGLPGLTADRFGDILVTEVLSYGLEQRKDALYRAFCQEFARRGAPLSGIYERNEAAIRSLEGLPQEKGWYRADILPPPPAPRTEIRENGVLYTVDVENGQKTGFFLDQKYNRQAVARLARGRRVLDCFTHTGSFALNAALGGAAHVTAVDVSQQAVDLARENARRNGLLDRMDFLQADVFDLLPGLSGKKPAYDFIILDPPAFTKSRKTLSAAQRGYKEINYRAMRLLPRGGFLATCSCSHFMEDGLFRQMLRQAARDAGVELKLIEARRAAPDHPVLLNVPETDYLKFYLLQVV